MKNVTTLLFVMLSIFKTAIAQDLHDKYCGVWNVASGNYGRDGFFNEPKEIERSDERLIILSNGTGGYLKNGKLEELKWNVKNGCLEVFSIDVSSSVRKYMLKGKYSDNDSCLQITGIHDNNVSKLHKANVNIELMDEFPQTHIKHEDKIFAFKNRILKDQMPIVTTGHYEKDKGKLFIENMIAFDNDIMRARKYDQLEIFVINSDYSRKNNIESFLITYNTKTDSISSVSPIMTFVVNRDYDIRKKRLQIDRKSSDNSIWNDYYRM